MVLLWRRRSDGTDELLAVVAEADLNRFIRPDPSRYTWQRL